jgi:hypothetical protein
MTHRIDYTTQMLLLDLMSCELVNDETNMKFLKIVNPNFTQPDPSLASMYQFAPVDDTVGRTRIALSDIQDEDLLLNIFKESVSQLIHEFIHFQRCMALSRLLAQKNKDSTITDRLNSMNASAKYVLNAYNELILPSLVTID